PAPGRRPRRSPAAGTCGRGRSLDFRFKQSGHTMRGMRAEPAVKPGLLTSERLLELRRPLEVDVSADGSRVAFTVSPAYREQGKGFETRLWVDGAEATEPGSADATPRLSPDGSQLAYASDE